MPMNPRLLRPRESAPAAFSPTSVTGLFTWWDFSDSSTVTLNSGNVSAVADKSGNGNYSSGGSRALIQASAGDQPLYNATLQNGKGGAVFDEDAHLYSGASSDWTFLHHGTDRYSMFIAGETKSDGNMFFGDMVMTAASGYPGILIYDFNNFGINQLSFNLDNGDGNNSLAAALDPFGQRNRPSVFHFAGSPVSGSPSFVVTVDTGATASDSDTFSTNSATPDYMLTFGHDGTNSVNTWKGRLYEILIYRRSTALSGAEATAIIDYLKAKWGIG